MTPVISGLSTTKSCAKKCGSKQSNKLVTFTAPANPSGRSCHHDSAFVKFTPLTGSSPEESHQMIFPRGENIYETHCPEMKYLTATAQSPPRLTVESVASLVQWGRLLSRTF